MKQFLTFIVCASLLLGQTACGTKKTKDEIPSVNIETNRTDNAKPRKNSISLKDSNTNKDNEKKSVRAVVFLDGPRPVNVTDEDLSASHILIMHKDSKSRPASITRTKKDAKKIIDDLYARLKAGADFAGLATKFSDCPSSSKGGNLGTFPASQMAVEFTESLKAVPVGEITEPVETPFGYHIIKRQKISKN